MAHHPSNVGHGWYYKGVPRCIFQQNSLFCIPKCLHNNIFHFPLTAHKVSVDLSWDSVDVDGQFQVEALEYCIRRSFSRRAAFTTLGGGAFEVAAFACQGAVFNKEPNKSTLSRPPPPPPQKKASLDCFRGMLITSCRTSVPMTTKHLSFRFNIRFSLSLHRWLRAKSQLFLKRRLCAVAGGTFLPVITGTETEGCGRRDGGELRVLHSVERGGGVGQMGEVSYMK